MGTENSTDPVVATQPVDPVLAEADADPTILFQPGPIHVQPSGEELFSSGGNVGGLHTGQGADRLPGADPLYDGSLEARLKKDHK